MVSKILWFSRPFADRKTVQFSGLWLLTEISHCCRSCICYKLLPCFLCRKLKNWWRKRKTLTDDEVANIARWDRDYKLTEVSQQGLFDEYLEMGMIIISTSARAFIFIRISQILR